MLRGGECVQGPCPTSLLDFSSLFLSKDVSSGNFCKGCTKSKMLTISNMIMINLETFPGILGLQM